mgnify:CR=1 FL=1
MKTTPFTETHISLGAKMHEFAGYNMPIEYSGIIDEHLTVCQGVGVFDVSHMGEFWVKGPHALDFLQTVTSNNVAALTFFAKLTAVRALAVAVMKSILKICRQLFAAVACYKL